MRNKTEGRAGGNTYEGYILDWSKQDDRVRTHGEVSYAMASSTASRMEVSSSSMSSGFSVKDSLASATAACARILASLSRRRSSRVARRWA